MDLETHLNELSVSDADRFRAVAQRLRSAPACEPSAGLTVRVLAAVEAERDRPPAARVGSLRGWAVVAAVAAGLLAGVTFFAWPCRPDSRAAEGADWIAAHQESDGTWDPVRHGGDPAYRPALTALGALALLRDPAHHAVSIDRACEALVAFQNADGSFGGTGRVQVYNQAIATYALAVLGVQRPGVKAALGRAVAFSRDRQSAEGGWDYVAGSEGNAAVTAWQVRALASAAEQGMVGAEVPLRRGLRWLRGAARADGSVAYHRSSDTRSESLSALAAYALMRCGTRFPGLQALGRRVAASLKAEPQAGVGADCYRDYAKVLAFESAGQGRQAEAVRGGMLKRQRAGDVDQWQGVGGSLYTHALTALVAQQPQGGR